MTPYSDLFKIYCMVIKDGCTMKMIQSKDNVCHIQLEDGFNKWMVRLAPNGLVSLDFEGRK